jgi:sodium-coupled monocarboxylate transporter 8/12
MSSTAASFSTFDYVIFGLMLTISAGIGVFYGFFQRSKKQTSKELLVANGQMGLFPSALSLLASFMSGITILGNPAESYNYGTMFMWSGENSKRKKKHLLNQSSIRTQQLMSFLKEWPIH